MNFHQLVQMLACMVRPDGYKGNVILHDRNVACLQLFPVFRVTSPQIMHVCDLACPDTNVSFRASADYISHLYPTFPPFNYKYTYHLSYLTYYIYNLTYITTNVPNEPLLTQYNLIYTYSLHGTLPPTSCPPRTDANIGLKTQDPPSSHCLPAKDAHVTLIYIINKYTSLQCLHQVPLTFM